MYSFPSLSHGHQPHRSGKVVNPLASPLYVSAGPTSSMLTKRALLSCRLPEPLQPEDDNDIKEFDMVEGKTAAFRARLPQLMEWTHYPEEGSPGSADLLDVIKTYAAHADATDARCGSVGVVSGVDQSGPGVWTSRDRGVDKSGPGVWTSRDPGCGPAGTGVWTSRDRGVDRLGPVGY